MSQLKKSDFYYGAVLSTLLNNEICPALIEGGTDRQVYDFTTDHKDFRLFLKFVSAPIKTQTTDYRSWQFVFSPSDISELNKYMKLDKGLSVGLICGEKTLTQSQYAVLDKEVISQIFQMQKDSVTISIKKGERFFRLFIGGGRDNAIRIKRNRLY